MMAVQNTANAALQGLLKARDEQAVIVAREQALLNQLEEAIAALETKSEVGAPVRQDMRHLGITDGSVKLIEEAGHALSTREIADQLKARGVTTKSKNWIPTVYATLANSLLFVRNADRWDLKKGAKR